MQYTPPGIITYLFSKWKECQKGDFNIRDLLCHISLEKLTCTNNLLINWEKDILVHFHSLYAFKKRKFLKIIRQPCLFHKATAAWVITQISQLQNKFLIVHLHSSLKIENSLCSLVTKLGVSKTCSDSKANLCAHKFLLQHAMKVTRFQWKHKK